jgi:hypothetical protein
VWCLEERRAIGARLKDILRPNPPEYCFTIGCWMKTLSDFLDCQHLLTPPEYLAAHPDPPILSTGSALHWCLMDCKKLPNYFCSTYSFRKGCCIDSQNPGLCWVLYLKVSPTFYHPCKIHVRPVCSKACPVFILYLGLVYYFNRLLNGTVVLAWVFCSFDGVLSSN